MKYHVLITVKTKQKQKQKTEGELLNAHSCMSKEAQGQSTNLLYSVINTLINTSWVAAQLHSVLDNEN